MEKTYNVRKLIEVNSKLYITFQLRFITQRVCANKVIFERLCVNSTLYEVVSLYFDTSS